MFFHCRRVTCVRSTMQMANPHTQRHCTINQFSNCLILYKHSLQTTLDGGAHEVIVICVYYYTHTRAHTIHASNVRSKSLLFSLTISIGTRYRHSLSSCSIRCTLHAVGKCMRYVVYSPSFPVNARCDPPLWWTVHTASWMNRMGLYSHSPVRRYNPIYWRSQ